jgi:hypothetical protein
VTEENYAQGPSTLSQVVEDLRTEGFTAELTALEGGDIRCGSCGEASSAGRFETAELRRTEGASDPADMSAVYGLVCPACATRGVLVAKFGPDASIAEADVLTHLDSAPPPSVG